MTTSVTLRAQDGLSLAGTLVTPQKVAGHAVVFVHGGGVTREEGGFFTRLAEGLRAAGVASLRYDLRGHGDSDGLQQETTLSAHLNDVHVAIAYLREATRAPWIHLLGASFGGGLVAYYAARRPAGLARLVLLNPQLDYKDRYIDQKPHWHGDHLSDEGARLLGERGYIDHSPTVKHGRAMLNEVFWIRPRQMVAQIASPTLIMHGTQDTFVSVEGSRQAARDLTVEHHLMEIPGAQHGFAVHDDPLYANPQSRTWQSSVITAVTEWITRPIS